MNKHILYFAAGLACVGFGGAALGQPAPDQGPPPGYGGSPPPGYGAAPPPGYNGGPPPDQMGAPPGAMGGPMAGAAPHGAKARFEAANVTHDGRLTQAQASAAGWRGVAKHFAEIDRDNKGYVTMQDIHAWSMSKRAAHAAPPPPPTQGPPPGQPQ
jgi:hypothetical protein